MSLGSIINIFLPKDRVFFSLFEDVAKNLVEMSHAFNAALKEQDFQKREELLLAIDVFEHKNDEFTHRIFIELGQNFITPFDREDIHYLATSLDDVADYIWSSAKRIVNYNIVELGESVYDFSNMITDGIASLHDALCNLRNMRNLKTITDACVNINSIENSADDLLNAAVSKLFDGNTNPLDVIKLKDLFEELEIVTDKCEDAANVIESIVIKYA